MTKAQKALEDLVRWSGPSEIDSYPYVRDVLTNVFGYPKDHVRLADKGSQGKIPDVSLVSADAKPKDGIYWVVGEVKRELGAFRSSDYRHDVWENQLKGYVTADTVYALLIDPRTIAVLRPDGTEIKIVELDAHTAEELTSTNTESSLAMLHYANSVCETSLGFFKEGEAPSRYLDVADEKDRSKFYEALRISARELIDYGLTRLHEHSQQYEAYQSELATLKEKIGTVKDERADLARKALAKKYEEAVNLFDNILRTFETQIGRQMPTNEDEARRFLENLYATEGSSLTLARILFVRFLEDHDMTSRRISNGGIKAFRDYHRHIKDDYQFLLTDAYREAEKLYRRLFEPSIFDWSHEGDGQLSKLLFRVFYRLNAFDFTKITGDILGNLYERFLDVKARKKLGEYYTPIYVAKYVIERIGFYDNPAPLIDPACGSGTFLIAAADGLIERMLQKSVKLDVAIKQVIELIHGLDINVFAAFIAQLQLIWHLLPYLKRINTTTLPELKIYGGNNSLVYSSSFLGNSLLTFSGLPSEAPIKVRDSKYRYVVGNPPYIRNERLKDKGPWRANYDFVDFRNSDVAYFFVARAIEGKRDEGGVVMPSWLEEGGRMCFVLPMGLCDAETSGLIRQKLMQYKILEITDMEQVAIHIFPSPQASGRATIAPILLFVEKTPAGETELVRVSEEAALVQGFEAKYLERDKLPQKVFQESVFNPHAMFLTKLKAADLPILQSLADNKARLEDYAIEPSPTFGIKVGAAGRLASHPSPGLLPFGKGQNIFAYYLNQAVTNWVDVGNVTDKSIWGKEEMLRTQKAYAFSNIAMAPQCVAFNPNIFALNNATVVFVPKPDVADFPWDVLLNSSIIRFVHLLTLRVGLVGVGTSIAGDRRVSWCHVNPRTVAAFPVPRSIFDYSRSLSALGSSLRDLAAKIEKRWDIVADELKKSPKKPLALFNIDFSNWTSDIEDQVDFRLEEGKASWTLRPYAEDQPTFLYVHGSYDLLNVVKYLLDQREEPLTVREFENLPVPGNYNTVSKLIDIARDSNSSDIVEFKKLVMEADGVIARTYGLNEQQREYIQNRLDTAPFDVLQPRWPWKGVEMREIQEYDIDRFA
jgi:type I restriction-modification system DNA methylase subunit